MAIRKNVSGATRANFNDTTRTNSNDTTSTNLNSLPVQVHPEYNTISGSQGRSAVLLSIDLIIVTGRCYSKCMVQT